MPRVQLVLASLILLSTLGCEDVWKHYAGGAGGQSFLVADEFVILNTGHLRGDVTWVVVRNWPANTSAEERLTDERFALSDTGEYVIRQPNGVRISPTLGKAYVFDDDRLETFWIRMQEDDFVSFRPERFETYAEVEEFLRTFERDEP